jgi:hypothetical protein
MPSLLKSNGSRIALGVLAVAVAWTCFQLGAHRHTGILRTMAAARQFLSSSASSQDLKRRQAAAPTGPQHRVTLSWKPSPSAVIGYNVYRRGPEGTTKVNAAPVAVTTYIDNSVQAGQTYNYATKAVRADGTESKPSNEVKVLIPSP